MTNDSNTAKRRKIGSRACDACKIRKVRCTEAPPCERCKFIGIACTFNKVQATRGPRSLRAKTLMQIREAQERERAGVEAADIGQVEGTNGIHVATDAPGSNSQSTSQYDHHQPAPPGWQWQPTEPRPRIPVAALVVRLCIYRLRLYPVWPIVAVEDVIATLQRDDEPTETYALANAVGAATMAQLKLGDAVHSSGGEHAEVNDGITAGVMEAECQRARLLLDTRGDGEASLNALRISFFLHIYHENQVPGGTKSLLYLRAAITLAQIMGLHRPSTYPFLPSTEQRMRRRIIWLLFVTERGVAMLHKLPVVITSSANLPSLDGEDGDDAAHILPAFKKLVQLFWIFDQSRAFDLIRSREDADDDPSTTTTSSPPHARVGVISLLDTLQRHLQDVRLDADHSAISDVQRADIYATRQWMQILLWRATNLDSSGSTISLLSHPVHIAREFLELLGRVPGRAIEAHGPAIEHKIFDIANAVTDAIARRLVMGVDMGVGATGVADLQPVDVLLRLQKMLASCRGGNKNLLASLCARIAEVEGHTSSILPAPRVAVLDPRILRVEEPGDDDDGRVARRDAWSGGENEPRLDGVRSFGAGPHRSPSPSASSSPWFSLVAAAELEQYSNSHQGAHQDLPPSPITAALNLMVNSLAWQPVQPLSQIRDEDGWPGSDETQSSPEAMIHTAGGEDWGPGV